MAADLYDAHPATVAHEIAARFPRLRARLDTAAAGYGASPEDSFEFGLQAILDGLQAKLASRLRD